MYTHIAEEKISVILSRAQTEREMTIQTNDCFSLSVENALKIAMPQDITLEREQQYFPKFHITGNQRHIGVQGYRTFRVCPVPSTGARLSWIEKEQRGKEQAQGLLVTMRVLEKNPAATAGHDSSTGIYPWERGDSAVKISEGPTARLAIGSREKRIESATGLSLPPPFPPPLRARLEKAASSLSPGGMKVQAVRARALEVQKVKNGIRSA